MIIESIFSTLGPGDQPNFAPMGITWGESVLTVRPFRATATYTNLLATGCGVLSLTDDVLPFVQSSLYRVDLPHFPAHSIPGVILQGACSWRELQVLSVGGTPERAEIRCQVVHTGHQREFLGFCRASVAVLEAAILATRLQAHTPAAVQEIMRHYAQIVEKTGGDNDRRAFHLVEQFIASSLDHA
ncbi:MAG TPA: DUF447 domain-containing protein [Anaerolineales bacterium]|nr:DUF447 domain-containing protein [Anaerolineales bacterium]